MSLRFLISRGPAVLAARLAIAAVLVSLALSPTALAQQAAEPGRPPTAAEAAGVAPPAPAAQPAPATPENPPVDPAEELELPELGSPQFMVIPTIGLNVNVSEVGVKNGTYEIPWFDVGWQKDSQPLGVPGNTVFNGHVDTIDAGRVFLRLHELTPGDAIYLYTPEYRTSWVVEWADAVPNSDWSFIDPTDDLRITLYTCEGNWSWTTQRYSQYRVVVARFYEYVAREDQTAGGG